MKYKVIIYFGDERFVANNMSQETKNKIKGILDSNARFLHISDDCGQVSSINLNLVKCVEWKEEVE